MNWFINLKTRTKFLLSFGTIILLLAVVAITGLASLETVRQEYGIAGDFDRLECNMQIQRTSLLLLPSLPDRAQQEAKLAEMVSVRKFNDELFARLKTAASDQPVLEASLAAWLSKRDEYNTFRDGKLIPLILEGKVTDAAKLFSGEDTTLFDQMRAQGRKASDEAREEAHDEVGRAITTVVSLGVGSLVIGLLLAVALNRIIAKPLVVIAAAAEEIAKGNLETGLEHRSTRLDEVGMLANAFSAMTGSLRNMADIAEQVATGNLAVAIEPQSAKDRLGHALASMVRRLSTLIGQVQKSGIQVTTSGTEIAATARQQQATASEISSTTTEIGATAQEISATARDLVRAMKSVTSVAGETAELASSGQSGLTRMQETMTRIMEASGSINTRLAVLSEKAGNINKVVTTITKVADQTNLLSLNAAIEAEKAGEYGRGFSVVATEIRRLADQTAVATSDIEQIVKEMQSAVSAGVMGMDKFSEEVRRGAEVVAQVSSQLAVIISKVQTLTPSFETVSEGMQSQSLGAQQISEALLQLGEAAQQTVESLVQSNQAIRQLNDVTAALQSGVSKFKLEG